jgi:uncharacterized protein (TIGR02118 family)
VSAKIVVLYPPPIDEAKFEHYYHGTHMPLMRKLIVPSTRVPTFRTRGPDGVPFYRMAEIHFPSLEELHAFGRSEDVKAARRSAEGIPTQPPIIMVCEQDRV